MQIEIIPEVGDILHAKKFCFKNEHGGTGLSYWDHDEKFEGKAVVKITKVWYDDECGYRCWAEAMNDELKEYLKRVAHPTDKRIFVSQFELEICN